MKYGIKRSKFKESDQPWNLSVTTVDTQADMKQKKNGKKDIKPNFITKEYCGKKEGGIGEGSMYFIFTQRPDFTFEAHPVEDWYNFRRKIQHRTLTDEEAEAAWDKRDKIVNHLNYMARKRLHLADEEEENNEEGTTSKPQHSAKNDQSNDLMIHDNEDYEMYMSGSSSEEEDEKSNNKKKKKDKAKPDEEVEEKQEAVEDSDDGEHEGTEIAYASDVSSESEELIDSKVAPRGVDELSSSSSDEEEEENKEKELEKKMEKAQEGVDSSGSGDSDSDIDVDDSLASSALFMQKKGTLSKDKKSKERSSSRSPAPNSDGGKIVLVDCYRNSLFCCFLYRETSVK